MEMTRRWARLPYEGITRSPPVAPDETRRDRCAEGHRGVAAPIYGGELRARTPLTDRHALKVHAQRGNGERVEVATVYLESTSMYFGGQRLGFRCPRCNGRCRILFGTWRIACRRCHKLRYASQKETKED